MVSGPSSSGASSSRPHRVGLIGAGRFAHLYHLPALLADHRAELVMISDPDPNEHAIRLAAQRAIPIVPDLAPVIAPGVCDAVIISTPHALHADQIRAAILAGKHVLVDKPLVLRGVEARELADLAARAGLIGSVAFNQRFSRAFQAAREIIGSGALGAIRRIETIQLGGAWVVVADGSAPRSTGPQRPAWYMDSVMSGGGVLTGRGAHMADIVPWLVGQAPRRLRARVIAGRRGLIDDGGTAEIDFGDFSWTLSAVADRAPLWDDVRIYGTAGRLEVRKPEGTLGLWEMARVDYSGRSYPVPAPGINGVAVPDFLDAIEGKGAPQCSFEDAWMSVRILEAIYASGRARGAWTSI